MSSNPAKVGPPIRHEIYVPGYAPAKLAMAALGIVLVALSLQKFGPLAKLAFLGGAARAEAVRIILTDTAGQETPMDTDAAVLASVKALEEARDHESVFWVEYRFTTADGRPAEARAPLGQHVKPLQPLRDRDGLPSTAWIWYDPRDPRKIAMPLQLGTWFMPGMLALFGVLGFAMGMILWRHAHRPIEMPDLSRSHAERNG